MTQRLPEPERQISRQAIKVWRISAIIFHFIYLAIIMGLFYLSVHYHWFPWIRLIFEIIIGLITARALYKIFIYPVYQQRSWRYDIDIDHVQLKYGIIEKTYVIVPMVKVQSVSTHQGPLLRIYRLSNVTIGTMATTHEIPAIPEDEAIELRERIATLARISEQET